jgi:dephospho-CoA kinase
MTSRHTLTWIARALGVALVAAATSAGAQTVKIGNTGALTGPYNEFGEGTRRGIESAIEGGAPYVLVAVPLLVESRDWRGRYQRVLVIDCPPEIQIERVMRRSGLDRAQVEAIMSAQASRDQRLAAADDVIDNSGEPGALTNQVARLDSLYRGLSMKGE